MKAKDNAPPAPSLRLPAEDEHALLTRYHEAGDAAARDEVIERLLPLARSVARRFAHTSEPLDDLIQVASIGLVKAVDQFDPGRGTRITSYAVPTMLGEIKRHLRDKGWDLHLPRGLKERASEVRRERPRLAAELGREPTPGELAGALRCSAEDVLEAVEASRTYRVASLHEPVGEPAASGELHDLVGAEDPGYEATERFEALAEGWTQLGSREREALALRLSEDLTQREIARRMDCSQMQVSRILRSGIDQLQEQLAA